jgi:hypothetical protein
LGNGAAAQSSRIEAAANWAEKMNILKEKFDFLLSTNMKLLSWI